MLCACLVLRLFCFTLPCFLLSCLAFSCLVLSYRILSLRILSFVSYVVLSCRVVFCLVLMCLALPRLALSCLRRALSFLRCLRVVDQFVFVLMLSRSCHNEAKPKTPNDLWTKPSGISLWRAWWLKTLVTFTLFPNPNPSPNPNPNPN